MPPPTKRRRLEPTAVVEEVLFDPSARQEYLTGFHKRKVQRAKAAQEIAAKRARQEKIEQRKRLREERRADLERHVKEVNDLIKPPALESGDEEEAEDSDDSGEAGVGKEYEKPVVVAPVDHEAEYIDEDRYTSVVVEEMDVTREGLRKANEDSEETGEVGDVDTTKQDSTASPSKRTWTKDKPRDRASKLKTKRKKFRYESKAERRVTRDKQRSKNREQAKARKAKR